VSVDLWFSSDAGTADGDEIRRWLVSDGRMRVGGPIAGPSTWKAVWATLPWLELTWDPPDLDHAGHRDDESGLVGVLTSPPDEDTEASVLALLDDLARRFGLGSHAA
jgi:hypothetical protein